jgi:uncharacterized protein YfiM (DUF2279 family)
MKLVLVWTLTFGGRGDSWFGVDKAKHFLVAAAIQSGSYAALRSADVRHWPSLDAGFGTTAAVSLGKEIYDRRRSGLFSWKDLAWDGAGAVAAAAVIHTTR